MTSNSFADLAVRAIIVLALLTIGLSSGLLAQESSNPDVATPADTPPPIPASGDDAIPAVSVPDDGTAVVRILAAQRFTLETPYASAWNAERSLVRSGTILVLEVEKKWLRPRQTRQPVLYAGDRPAEVMNCGHAAGRIVVIVPDPADGTARNLATTIFFFGTPMLAERATAERGRAELAEARAQGIGPLSEKRRVEPSASTLRLADQNALLREVGARIILHSPTERALGEGFLGTP